VDKSDWVLFSEFELSVTPEVGRSEVYLHHAKCKALISVTIREGVGMSLATFIKYATEHKKNDCKKFQGLTSRVTVYNETY
jgi:hypothetical protein